MDELVGIKELYDVNLRLLNPLEIAGRKYDMNESVLSFKTAEIAQFQENKRTVQARGGYKNPALINWEIDRDATFAISHGVLSPKSWALLSNSQLKKPNYKSIQYQETVDTVFDNQWVYADLKYNPNACDKMGAQPNPFNEPLSMGRRPELMLKPIPPTKVKWIFVYDSDTGEKIRDFKILGNRILLGVPARHIFVDYTFTYDSKILTLEIGNRLMGSFLKLQGKISVKDQKSGEVRTGILEMPKIRIASKLQMTLGMSYETSTVSDFYFVGTLDKDDKDSGVAQVSFLDKELSGEYL